MITVCQWSDLTDPGSRGFLFGGEPAFLVKKDNAVFAYRNRCPHLGIELEWQPHDFLDSQHELIQCSMHGALFLIATGECVHGPCLGQALEPLTVQVRDGIIRVGVPDQA